MTDTVLVYRLLKVAAQAEDIQDRVPGGASLLFFPGMRPFERVLAAYAVQYAQLVDESEARGLGDRVKALEALVFE